MTRDAAGPRVARVAERADPGLVGRAGELARLRERLGRAAGGQPCVALVTGPEGIGKTALVAKLAREASGAHRVVAAAGDEAEACLPFAALEQLAGRLGGPGAGAAPAQATDAAGAGAELLRLLAAADGPLLLVLDDAQWADGPSLAAITYAMRRVFADPVMLVVACRDGAVGRLPGGLLRLARGERGLELALEGLRAHALAELASRLGGELPSPRAAARLREHTGGNPKHAAELLRELEPGALDRTDLPLPAPRGSRDAVLALLAGLSAPARELAAAAAVLGRRAPLRSAARMAGLDDPLPALQEAVDAGLLELVDRPGGHDLAFRAQLARGAVYHDLGPARRAALHAAAAGLTAGGAALAHRAAAALVPDAGLARELAEAARREAARAPGAAGAGMVAAARVEPDPARAADRLVEGVELLLDAGEVARAAALEPELGELAEAPRAALARGRLALARGRAEQAEPLLREAWERAAGGDRAEAALRLAALARLRGRWDDAIAHAELGSALAREAGQRALLGVLEATLAALLAARGEAEPAEQRLAAVRALAREPGPDTAVVAAAAWAAVEAGAARGDPARTLEDLAAVIAPAAWAAPAAPGASAWRPLAAEALAELDRPDEADRLLDALERDPSPDPAARSAAARARGLAAAARGRAAEAADAFARARALLAGRTAPLESARLDEAEGRALLRAGGRRAAAERLEAARAAYARLGARPALARCERELAACGAAGRGARARERPLTARERAVADLVAGGLTNRAVAERLVVSVKTVEFHLANAFAKMGVRSRTQLAVALVRDREPR